MQEYSHMGKGGAAYSLKNSLPCEQLKICYLRPLESKWRTLMKMANIQIFGRNCRMDVHHYNAVTRHPLTVLTSLEMTMQIVVPVWTPFVITKVTENRKRLYILDWLHRALQTENRKNRRKKASLLTVFSYPCSNFVVNGKLKCFLFDMTNIRV